MHQNETDYEPDGELAYAGKVGTGFDQETLVDLRRRLEPLRQPRAPFDKGAPPRGLEIHWVRPQLVAKIGFSEWTQNGLLRQPCFEGLRLDKKARDVRRERTTNTEEA